MDKKLLLKQLGAAVSGFVAGALSVLVANQQASPRQIVIVGLASAATSLGWLHVSPASTDTPPVMPPPAHP